MAKNREHEKPVESESESESGDEADKASSEEVGSSDSDSEPEKVLALGINNSKPPSSSKPQQPSSSSDDESGSESESDGPNHDIRSLASRHDPATPTKPTASKRPAEGKEKAKDNKRLKKKLEREPEKNFIGSNDDTKKLLFQRVWSEDDEIVILKGMIDYEAKKKSNPLADLNAFLNFIKKNLHVDVTRAQLQDKIRRLKKKYENNKSKEETGKYKAWKAHEQETYELSKSVWGNENGKETGVEKVPGSPKVNRTAVKKWVNAWADGDTYEVKSLEVANGNLVLLIRGLISNGTSMEERISRTVAELVEGLKKVEGARECTKLAQVEMELNLMKLDFLRAQTKLVLDVLKSTDH